MKWIKLNLNRAKPGIITKACLCGCMTFAGLSEVPVHADATVKPSFSGSLRGTYDYRGLGDYDDHDGYAYWYLRGRNLSDGYMDIYTSGRLHSDLDGTGSSYADDPFISLEDTSRSSFCYSIFP